MAASWPLDRAALSGVIRFTVSRIRAVTMRLARVERRGRSAPGLPVNVCVELPSGVVVVTTKVAVSLGRGATSKGRRKHRVAADITPPENRKTPAYLRY